MASPSISYTHSLFFFSVWLFLSLGASDDITNTPTRWCLSRARERCDCCRGRCRRCRCCFWRFCCCFCHCLCRRHNLSSCRCHPFARYSVLFSVFNLLTFLYMRCPGWRCLHASVLYLLVIFAVVWLPRLCLLAAGLAHTHTIVWPACIVRGHSSSSFASGRQRTTLGCHIAHQLMEGHSIECWKFLNTIWPRALCFFIGITAKLQNTTPSKVLMTFVVPVILCCGVAHR